MMVHFPRVVPGWRVFLLVLLGGCQTTHPTLRTGASVRHRLQTQLDGLMGRIDPGVHVGVQVLSSKDNTMIYEHNARQRFVPASTLKVFTGAAALFYLGPAHRFVTDVLIDEPEHNGKVVRNVYLRGSGDPSLSDADLMSLAAALKQQGVTSITGDVVLDDTAFDATPWGRGWMWDDLPDGFSAPVGGLNVMHNELVVSVSPGPRPDTLARLRFAPNTGYVSVANAVNTGSPSSGAAVRAQGSNVDSMGLVPGQTVALSGSVPADSGTWTRRFAVRDGAQFAGVLLREHLHALRIEVLGTVRRGVTPVGAVLSASHQSRELSAALIDFMKVSNNHGMECLLKRVGANTALAPGSWQNGVAAVRSFLAVQVGLDPSGLAVTDGSGDSRYSLVSPSQLVALLSFMQRSFEMGPEFIASLPIGATDGTLVNRMLPPELHAKVRAKTGTMAGVSSLAGYMATEDQDVLVFSIMTEGFVGSAEAYRRLQDEILLTLARAR